MAISFVALLLHFVISLIVSTIIIYIVVKLFGEKEGIGTAVMAAFFGSVIYAVAYYFLGTGLLAAVIGGIAWLIALRSLYKIGWVKALLVAVVVWIFTAIIGMFLPTLIGPL
jgi:hypothetical protein